MKMTRIAIIVLTGILLAVGCACKGGGNGEPTLTPTPTPVLMPTIAMSCDQARDAIQEALIDYNDEYGEWPTADGQPGDIEWTKLVPYYMEGVPSNDRKCDWWVNSDPEGEVCLLHRC